MTLNQLRAFLMVATLGTFSAAAHELQMTQPSISELVKRMEEHYGVKLFVRGARRLVLTPAGTELLPYARQAVSEMVVNGGFPPYYLQPINFEQLYAEQMRRRAAGTDALPAGTA